MIELGFQNVEVICRKLGEKGVEIQLGKKCYTLLLMLTTMTTHAVLGEKPSLMSGIKNYFDLSIDKTGMPRLWLPPVVGKSSVLLGAKRQFKFGTGEGREDWIEGMQRHFSSLEGTFNIEGTRDANVCDK